MQIFRLFAKWLPFISAAVAAVAKEYDAHFKPQNVPVVDENKQ